MHKGVCYLLSQGTFGRHVIEKKCTFSEYADNGSLYAFLQRPENVLNFAHILQWAEEIAMGKCFFFSDFNRERSLGQGNVFIPVCHSVHGGGRGSPTGRGLYLGEEGSAYRGGLPLRGLGRPPPN